MYSSILPLLLLIGPLVTAPVHAATYWVDNSCSGKISPGDAITTEALKFAARAGVRNAKGSADANQASVFQRLFKVTQSDTTTNDEVQCLMDGIGATTVSTQRNSADIRIYCDNDVTSKTGGTTARWQLVPDRDQDPDWNKNSQRVGKNSQEWYDQVNFVRRSLDTLGCQDPGTLAETCKLCHKQRSAIADVCTADTQAVSSSDPRASDQTQDRSVITICCVNFGAPFKLKALSAIPATSSFNFENIKLTGNALNVLVSRTLLHELTHTQGYCKKDVLGNPNSYGWTNIQALTAAQALQNADTFAFYGVVAGLADRYIKVSTDSAQAEAGVLVKDTTIPQRKMRRGTVGT